MDSDSPMISWEFVLRLRVQVERLIGGLKMRFAIIVMVIAAFISAATNARAQGCSMSRKSINIKLTMCSQEGCQQGFEALNFVGDKVVHYQNPAEQDGTVYKIGKTVDFCDPQTESYRPRLCRNEFGPMRAHGTATFVGSSLTLQLVQDYVVAGVAARTTQIMRVEIQGCNACRVVGVRIEAASLDGRFRSVSQMAGPQAEFCKVL